MSTKVLQMVEEVALWFQPFSPTVLRDFLGSKPGITKYVRRARLDRACRSNSARAHLSLSLFSGTARRVRKHKVDSNAEFSFGPECISLSGGKPLLTAGRRVLKVLEPFQLESDGRHSCVCF